MKSSKFLKIFSLVFPLFGFLYSFMLKEKKFKYFLLFIMISSFKVYTSDLENYHEIYSNSYYRTNSLLYFIFFLSNKLGISFKLFLSFFLFISYNLIYWSVFNYLNKINAQKFSLIVFLNLLLFPQIFDQSTHILKQFMSSSIIVYVLSHEKNRPKTFILSLISILIHPISLVLLLIIFYQRITIKNFLFFVSGLLLLAVNIDLVTSTESYSYLIEGSLTKVDNSQFNIKGLIFLYSFSAILLLSYLFSFRLNIFTNKLILLVLISLIIQFLPERLYVLKYRFVLFSYLPLIILLYSEIVYWCIRYKFNTHFIFTVITAFNLFNFINNFGDVFFYKFNPYNLFFMI